LPTVGAATPPGSSQAPVAERRLVSVLFADLVGFTALVEGRDAEDTRELLSRYFDLARDVVGRYGGTVEKFIGDAVMAVWGAPTAHEDDAERAVRAGLELVDLVRTLGPGIQARAGVLTGEAVVTIGATNQGIVAGDLVNTASRLQSVAAPGTVLVGEATERAASRAIAFEPAGEQTLKGKAAPVHAWRALRVVAEVGGRNRAATLEAPFVGRDDELRLLKDLFHATTREHKARLVSVIGPGGIGKTRLAWEFLKYLDGLVEPVWWHNGRSPAYGDGISFWALGEMVRGRCGLIESDDEATTRAKIAATVAEHVPDEAERRWIEPALLALLGIETGVSSEQLFGAWRAFFERLATTAPVVMVFEDFHHADSGLIDFVDHLLEWSRSFPIYVVTLSRPDLLERRPEWVAGKRSFTSLFLEPLPAGAMRDLLAGLVPGLPQAAMAAIVGRADGVPLYAVETVRMLLSQGKLTLEGDAYRPIGDLTDLAVPDTLTALIASRLDALPVHDRTIVSDAAVLGQTFTIAGLSAVSGVAEPDLETRLRALVRREILALETDPRSPGRGQYTFVQALIREVAYNALAKRDRKSRHLAAARFFESLDAEETAGSLAVHYLAAFRNSPEGAEANAVAGQARIALRAAAQRAISLGSHHQAMTLFEQALAVTIDPAETADLLERAGEAATLAGRYEAAEPHLQAAIAAQRDLENPPAIAGATVSLGRMLLASYRTPEAIILLQSAVDEFADLAREPAGIALAGHLARAYARNDNLPESLEIAERVLEAAEHAELFAVVADTLITKGTSLGSVGRPIEGLATIAAGRDLAEALGLADTLLRAINNLAYIQGPRDPRAALSITRIGLTLARRFGIRAELSSLSTGLSEFGLRTGGWTSALEELTATLDEEWEPIDRAWILGGVVELEALRGKPVADRLDELHRLVSASDDPQAPGTELDAAAFAAFAIGDLTEARTEWHRQTYSGAVPICAARAARAALWLADPTGAKEDLAALDESGIRGPAIAADRRTIEAGLAALDGRAAEALTIYREALRSWRDLGLVWDEALCGIDMATLLDPADPEVRAAALASREILVRLEAAPFISRLDAATARSPEPALTGR
jgi:class 3 adenylate cyclase/tetratricopeptide (TPR) repeat protein